FHILNDYSTVLWEQQMKMILEVHGLICFIVHPDYLTSPRPRHTYEALLGKLCGLASDHRIWLTLPREVDRWWRLRDAMKLEPAGQSGKVEGMGSESAVVAYARLDGERLAYDIGDAEAS